MEKQLSQEESFEMIQSMINISRQNFRNGGFYYIVWGSLFFAAAIAQYVLYAVFNSELHWLSWAVAGALAIVLNIFVLSGKKKKPQVKTYVGRVNTYLWTGFVISIIFIAFLASQRLLSETQINPLIIMMYGFTTFISGGMLRFKWMIAGAIAAWIIAIICSFQDYGIQMILVAAAILISYLIPGIILNYTKESYV
ncbi:MAG: hypothetical protein H6540_06180 [Bacteroidales bacterium]|nr:hypothetical protein [Bacteroidales bacterium]MCB9012784.1 hypothetical protein [Bacteroidales bacterium]